MRLLRVYLEIEHRGLFPYRFRRGPSCLDTDRLTIPIAPNYESILAKRMEQLASKFGLPDFEEYVRECIRKDLFDENPHLGSSKKKKTLVLRQKEPLMLTERCKDEKDLEKYVDSFGASFYYLVTWESEDKERRALEAISARLSSLSLEQKELLVYSIMERYQSELNGEGRNAFLMYLLLKISTELASKGHYDRGIQLIKEALDREVIWFDTGQSVLVDHMGKLYFANEDFVRSEMCFEEIARREHWEPNARPYNFHLGIIEIANKHYERAKEFLLRASRGFESRDAAKRFDEAVWELYSRISERKNQLPLLRP